MRFLPDGCGAAAGCPARRIRCTVRVPAVAGRDALRRAMSSSSARRQRVFRLARTSIAACGRERRGRDALVRLRAPITGERRFGRARPAGYSPPAHLKLAPGSIAAYARTLTAGPSCAERGLRRQVTDGRCCRARGGDARHLDHRLEVWRRSGIVVRRPDPSARVLYHPLDLLPLARQRARRERDITREDQPIINTAGG